MKTRTVLLLIIALLLLATAAQADTLVLPSDLEQIGSEAFRSISVDYVEFPASVHEIADDAFSDATFTGTGAPGIYAQEWCEGHGFEYQAYSTPIEDFEYENTAGGVAITYYLGDAERVVIPQEIDGQDVVEIGYSAFQDCSMIKQIYLPNTLEVIGDYAFSGCTALESIYLPDSVTEMGERAFYQCTAMRSVRLSEQLLEISQYAFAYSGLKQVYLPDSIEFIEPFAFYKCHSLEAVRFSDYLDEIQESAFQECTSLTSVDLPESLTYMGYRAFRECTALTHFGYPVNVLRVGGVFLYGCSSLKEVTIPEGVYRVMDYFIANAGSVETIHFPSTITEIGKYSFAYENAFTSITLPDSVELIDENAFLDCTNLEEIHFSANLDRINTSAFDGCSSLTSIDLPESLAFMGYKAFRNCTSLTHFGYPVGIREVDGTFLTGCTSLTEITVPEGVTWLMDYFVCNQGTVTTINLPSSLREIGKYAFYGENNAFTTVNLPEGVQVIDEEAFANNKSMTSIDIPGSVTYIGLKAFDGVSNLRTITFHDGLRTIETYAFRGCSSVRTITLPNTVQTLGCAVFENCTSLTTFNSSTGWTDVFVPGSLSTLAGELGGPRGVLAGCTKLTRVTIPEGATCIPRYAFSYSPNLTTVTLPSTIERIGTGAFMESPVLRTINYPDGLTEIGLGAFRNCSALRDANLPDSVTTIGCDAFRDCTSINSIHFPRNWTTVTAASFYGNSWDFALFANADDYNIFGGDYKITTVEIPDGATCIPTCAFQNCSGLRTVTVPESVTSIGAKAFAGCSALPKVYIYPSVTTVGDDVFEDCSVITVWCEYESTILQYCIDNDVPYYYLTPDGVNKPSGSLYLGDSYSLHGYARASVPLTEVTATIWNSDKTEALQTITVIPNCTDYSLSGTVNYNMLFGKLPLGNYRYTLEAETEISSEIWADCSFSIVPPPLRVGISGFSDFSDIIGNGSLALSGAVHANYSIDSLKILILNGNEQLSCNTVSPNSTSFDLSSVTIDVGTVPTGNYTLKVVVYAHNESKTALIAPVTIANASVPSTISDSLREEIAEYLEGNYYNIFEPCAEAKDYLANLSFWDQAKMGLSDYKGIFAAKLKDVLYGTKYNNYMVRKYESEIAEILDGMYKENRVEHFEPYGQMGTIITELYDLAGSDAEFEIDEFKQWLNDKNSDFSVDRHEELETLLLLKNSADTITKLDKSIQFGTDFINFLVDLTTDHAQALKALEIIEESCNPQGNQDFAVALENLKYSYKSQFGKCMIEISRKISDELIKAGQKKVTKLILKKAGASAGSMFSLADTVAELLIKYSGIEEAGERDIDFLTQLNSVWTLKRAFTNACDHAKGILDNNGNLTATDVSRIQVTFQVARKALIRLYRTLVEADYDNHLLYLEEILDTQWTLMPGVDHDVD